MANDSLILMNLPVSCVPFSLQSVAHPDVINCNGVECLIKLINSERVELQQLGANSLALLIPYCTYV